MITLDSRRQIINQLIFQIFFLFTCHRIVSALIQMPMELFQTLLVKLDFGPMILSVMMEIIHLSATLMEVLVATITTQYGITSALSVNVLKNSLLFLKRSRFMTFHLLSNHIVELILYHHR